MDPAERARLVQEAMLEYEIRQSISICGLSDNPAVDLSSSRLSKRLAILQGNPFAQRSPEVCIAPKPPGASPPEPRVDLPPEPQADSPPKLRVDSPPIHPPADPRGGRSRVGRPRKYRRPFPPRRQREATPDQPADLPSAERQEVPRSRGRVGRPRKRRPPPPPRMERREASVDPPSDPPGAVGRGVPRGRGRPRGRPRKRFGREWGFMMRRAADADAANRNGDDYSAGGGRSSPDGALGRPDPTDPPSALGRGVPRGRGRPRGRPRKRRFDEQLAMARKAIAANRSRNDDGDGGDHSSPDVAAPGRQRQARSAAKRCLKRLHRGAQKAFRDTQDSADESVSGGMNVNAARDAKRLKLDDSDRHSEQSESDSAGADEVTLSEPEDDSMVTVFPCVQVVHGDPETSSQADTVTLNGPEGGSDTGSPVGDPSSVRVSSGSNCELRPSPPAQSAPPTRRIVVYRSGTHLAAREQKPLPQLAPRPVSRYMPAPGSVPVSQLQPGARTVVVRYRGGATASDIGAPRRVVVKRFTPRSQVVYTQGVNTVQKTPQLVVGLANGQLPSAPEPSDGGSADERRANLSSGVELDDQQRKALSAEVKKLRLKLSEEEAALHHVRESLNTQAAAASNPHPDLDARYPMPPSPPPLPDVDDPALFSEGTSPAALRQLQRRHWELYRVALQSALQLRRAQRSAGLARLDAYAERRRLRRLFTPAQWDMVRHNREPDQWSEHDLGRAALLRKFCGDKGYHFLQFAWDMPLPSLSSLPPQSGEAAVEQPSPGDVKPLLEMSPLMLSEDEMETSPQPPDDLRPELDAGTMLEVELDPEPPSLEDVKPTPDVGPDLQMSPRSSGASSQGDPLSFSGRERQVTPPPPIGVKLGLPRLILTPVDARRSPRIRVKREVQEEIL
ncbi:uncharacterized protein LOC122373329 [Amphibalanus amphitrite]|uniref:uncharacterized protein LOC122373329 n=1 Tax=Amphibalanus amphitrite TaxID=1232801 RepID=UPI001C9143BB|nr:uncharacterized protein LOC122373329 [Amphibalanus amphitrite]XP_043207222.1 uncharacterized protein LOC122373329 [Amphibalanus amphitrite]XP_043207223.1 uncharacterized protein LOC122373329 [Amphibalanus amphitrite]XP_043207224.1 uncharacterized protein LOC122373329 [Amphibalanus amphitrite]